MELATVNNQTMTIKEYNGQRVLTFKDIDKAHGRPDGTASRAFRANRKHFIEGTDYVKISPDVFRRTIGFMDKRQTNDIYGITESGYLMLAKSFTDDLAWTVQRQLVNCYFRYKEQAKTEYSPNELKHERMKAVLRATGYSYYDKTYNGEPVILLKDVAYYTGISTETAITALRKHGKYGTHYLKVDHAQMMNFKNENKNVPACYTHLILVTKSGFILLAELYGLDRNIFGCFADPVPALPEKPNVPAPAKPTVDELITALNVIRYARHNSEECEKIANMSSMADYYAKEQAGLDTARKYIGKMLTL